MTMTRPRLPPGSLTVSIVAFTSFVRFSTVRASMSGGSVRR
jgi:hypothetical protein